MILTSENIAALAAAANAAPSADNRHVFQLEARGDFLALRARNALAAADRTRRVLGIVSIGAVAENLVLRGRQLGIELTPTWQPAGDTATNPAGRVVFSVGECPLEDSPLAAAIAERHTNRTLLLRGPRLSAASLLALTCQAEQIAGTAVQWLDKADERRQALRLIRRAETERFRNPILHQELFESIRFDVGWQATAAEGLPPASLALPALERPAFALLRHWGVQRAANLLGTHWFVGWRGADLPCRLAAHLGVVKASGPIDQAAFQAGRLLERLWLHATVLGLGFQVFAAAPLYALEQSTAISPALRAFLDSGWAALCPPGTRALLVFRMGHAPAPVVRAGRPDPRLLLTPPPDSAERVVA